MARTEEERDAIIIAAMHLWREMLPHDYEPWWTTLGLALGELPDDEEDEG